MSMRFMQRRISYMVLFFASSAVIITPAMIYSLTKISGKGLKDRVYAPQSSSTTPYYAVLQKYMGHITSFLKGSYSSELNEKTQPIIKRSALIVHVHDMANC